MKNNKYGSICINTKEFEIKFSNKNTFDHFLILYYELLNPNVKVEKMENSKINKGIFICFYQHI